MVFLQVMGIIFCIVLIGGAIIFVVDWLDWRREINGRLENHYTRIQALDNKCNHLDRAIASLYEQNRCK